MKQQMSFAQNEYDGKKKVTRRERFLGEMERVVPPTEWGVRSSLSPGASQERVALLSWNSGNSAKPTR